MVDRTDPIHRRISDFQTRVYRHYEREGRDLPWRKTTDPYKILVSEVMLQQSQVSRVVEKYQMFIRLFPDPESLAHAPLHNILSAWQGMGYNRRALSLKKSAQRIREFHSGMVPEDEESLLSLPGIGVATARAIQAFAFNKPVILIETNIRAVFIHHFFPEHTKVPDSAIYPLVARTLDAADPRKWYNALMDYGVHLKKLYGNPARLSAHYRRQAPFKGSIRQARGAILRVILEKMTISEGNLMEALSLEADQLSHILKTLEAEGLIVNRGGRVSIAQRSPR